nr:MAG TPA: hypothetical protein [Caudoviricetes sp.]
MANVVFRHNGTVVSTAIVPVSYTRRLSEEFDNGTVTYYSTSGEMNAPIDKYEIIVSQKTYDFIGTEEVAKVKNGLYKNVVYLTEPTKLLEGVLIDGFAVSQPKTENLRKTLYEVVTRLLAVTPFDESIYTLTTQAAIVGVLQATISPEFRFNTQTTLFECLMEVGAVINAFPRLTKDGNGEFTVVTFDFINEYGQAVTASPFTDVSAYGENVDEEQYHSKLAAVVENLIEE